jgi:hypothetical protein
MSELVTALILLLPGPAILTVGTAILVLATRATVEARAQGGAPPRWARVVAWLTGGALVAHGLCLTLLGVVMEVAVLRAR